MTEISRVSLFGKLNKLGYQAVEGATVFCKMRGNPYVEVVHWMHQILNGQDSDLHRIVDHYKLDPGKIAAEMTRNLDGLPRGASSIQALSAHLMDAMGRGWVWGSLLYSSSQVRPGHLLLGMLKTPALRNILATMSPELAKIGADDLADNFSEITDGSPEDRLSPQDGSQTGGGAVPGEASGAMSPAEMGKGEALEQFCTDLTEQARNGEIDPIVGRDEEIRQIVDVRMRRRQNKPILTGEAGVGKTAVVEGFAIRIARGDVPPALRDVRLLVLDVGLLQAGASMKGEFENRLRQVIDEVQASPTPIVMFVDETHTLVGAGGAAGTGDAANLLKPALARGTLRTIGATTWAEYKKYIEKDPALTRRFQVVQVDEPDIPKAILMMRGIASMLENHHRVQVLDEGIEAAVTLSARYIPARQLPDKSVSLLDTACARVAVSQHAVPAEVDDSRRRIEALTTELEIIDRDETAGYDVAERREAVSAAKESEEERLKGLEERWEAEKTVVESILDLRAKLREGANPVDTDPALLAEGEEAPEGGESGLSPEERETLFSELKAKNAELEELQG
ncbi:MAG: AAA family ATPase, partial [Arenibacterium sp.]